MDALLFAAMLAVPAGILAFAIQQAKKEREAFLLAVRDDADVEVASGPRTRIQTRRPPFVTVTAAGGGKNNPRRWDVEGSAARVGRRTSLHLSREGVGGALRELVGLKDLRTGDVAFDEAFTVRGSEPDALRGILTNDDVRQAVLVFFGLPAWSFEVRGEAGLVDARCPRAGLDAAHAKQVALAAQRLVAVLEQHADDPAVREQLATSAGGSATGAPVGVPLGGGR